MKKIKKFPKTADGHPVKKGETYYFLSNDLSVKKVICNRLVVEYFYGNGMNDRILYGESTFIYRIKHTECFIPRSLSKCLYKNEISAYKKLLINKKSQVNKIELQVEEANEFIQELTNRIKKLESKT